MTKNEYVLKVTQCGQHGFASAACIQTEPPGAALSQNLISATALLAVNVQWRVYIQVHVERASVERPWCSSTREPVISFWDHVR